MVLESLNLFLSIDAVLFGIFNKTLIYFDFVFDFPIISGFLVLLHFVSLPKLALGIEHKTIHHVKRFILNCH